MAIRQINLERAASDKPRLGSDYIDSSFALDSAEAIQLLGGPNPTLGGDYVDSAQTIILADARITNALKDEDNMSSNSAIHLASQQSIKAYVDGITGGALKDEDNMSSNSATHVASQQSIKAYADALIPAAIKDEDNMASNSASHVPSQQSVKAYVDGLALSLIDEDNMSTNSATRPPSQQSVKAYVDTNAGSAITIQEEGSSLSTAASTINFVGTNVTASGTGATKTVTVTGLSLIDEDNMSTNSAARPPSQQSVKAYVDGITGGALKDEDNMSSNSATHVASQQSIKAYADGLALSLIDEDNMATNSATRPPSQQSVKAYVDGVASGLDVKKSVRVASTANGTLASAFANGQTVDGISLSTGNRILIKDQSTGSENGIYTVNSSGAPTRATDFDANSEATGGAFTFVEEGTANANLGFVLTNTGSITLGSTALTFSQFSGAGQITAGSALTKSANTLNVAVDDATIEINSDALRLKADGINDTHIDWGTGTNQVSTADVPENTNLYYTDARADARITNALKDEDNMASNSATHVASQQSIKAYVDASILTKDNTDEITEGSSNLYFTNARADARITNALKDEDNMSSNSATHVASQQSIKAYVDASALSLIDEDNMSTNSATRPPSQQSVKAYTDGLALSLIDEDNMSTNSATRPPSQQSVKAYVDAVSIPTLGGDYVDSAEAAKIASPALTAITVAGASGSAYTFSGDGFPVTSGNNPVLHLYRGKKYQITNGSSGSHPLYIKTVAGSGTSNQYTSGVTGNGGAVVTFEVPFNAPKLLYYQCSAHAAMSGSIHIVDVATSIPTFGGDYVDSAATNTLADARIAAAAISALSNVHTASPTDGQVLTWDNGNSRWHPAASGGSGSGIDWVGIKTSGYTATAGQGVLCNTTGGAFTVTLPSGPSLGDMVRVVDAYNIAGTNNITIASPQKIRGSDSDLRLNINEAAMGLVYTDATRGWILIEY